MEHPDKIYEEVDALSTTGNDLMDDEHSDAAGKRPKGKVDEI